MSARDRADVRFRAAVYERWGRACVRCGVPASEVAHVMSRRFARTRCDVANARPLCNTDHALQHAARWHWDELIGREEYRRLYDLASDPAWKIPHDHWQNMPIDSSAEQVA